MMNKLQKELIISFLAGMLGLIILDGVFTVFAQGRYMASIIGGLFAVFLLAMFPFAVWQKFNRKPSKTSMVSAIFNWVTAPIFNPKMSQWRPWIALLALSIFEIYLLFSLMTISNIFPGFSWVGYLGFCSIGGYAVIALGVYLARLLIIIIRLRNKKH